MAYAYAGAGAPDDAPCQYGASKLLFRGPARDLSLPHVVALGGTETFGKFVRDPWPAQVETLTGLRVVNLGAAHAGPDAWLTDGAVLTLAARARLVLLQVPGAGNLTNRFFAVHPRRNDRFLFPSRALTQLYPEVDFVNFNFTGHLLRTLHRISPRRFAGVTQELQTTWVARMREVAARLQGPLVLVWMARSPPPAQADAPSEDGPMLVDRGMLAALQPGVADLIEVAYSDAAQAAGLEGMVFAPAEAAAARGLPGPAAQTEVARAVAARLERLL